MDNIIRDNIIYNKSKEFAIRIIKLHKYLSNEKSEKVMSNQLLRCGTSIGANVSESVFAISSNDFVNKLHIAIKEASETAYWLDILYSTEYLKEKEFESIYEQCRELIKLLTSSLNTVKNKI